MIRKTIKPVLCVLLSIIMIFAFVPAFYALELDVAPVGSDIEITDTKGDVIGITGLNKEGSDVKADEDIPSYYSSRDLGYTTDIKNQYQSNLCWAYSATTTLETFQNRTYGETISYSPLHMAYINSQFESNKGWIVRPNWLTSGGRPEHSIGYLTSYYGARESYLENNDIINLSFFNLEAEEARHKKTAQTFDENSDALLCVDSVLYINTDDRNSIKSAIMNYGAVNSTFVVNDDSFDPDEITYYCPDVDIAYKGGHSISIIGWNDSYSRHDFMGDYIPPNDGAWICQNSWGKDSGADGIIYISYDDDTLFNEDYGVTWAINETHQISSYESMYQLTQPADFSDYAPWSNQDEIIYMNRFDFDDFEYLERVYFESQSVGAQYKVYLIPITSSGTPESVSKWTLLKSGTVTECGYSCIKTPYQLEKGKAFIGISLKKQNGSSNRIGITNNIRDFYTIPNLESGSSYAAFIADKTLKRYDMTQKNAVFTIKAQTTKDYRYGDADLSRKVDISDATAIQQKLAFITTDSPYSELCADCDHDSKVTIVDVTHIQRYLANVDNVCGINSHIK